MKPLRLKMFGIGPYAGNVDIDFSLLNQEGLFLITGPTGAGKTSIFDGITYALFGETNFNDSEKKGGIISNFLDEKDYEKAFAEFTFEINGEEFTVKRIPSHFKFLKNGQPKKTQDSETLEISGPHSRTIPSKKSDRDTYIQNEILMLDAAQFKKLIMLPQGAFSEFIQSDSNDKKKILEKIFDTDIFKIIEDKLYDRAKNSESEIKQEKLKIKAKLEALKIPEIDSFLVNDSFSFEDLKSILHSKERALLESIEEKEKSKNSLKVQEQYDKIRSIEIKNSNILESKRYTQELNTHLERDDEIKGEKEKLTLFENSQKLAPAYSATMTKKKTFENTQIKLKESQKKFSEFERVNSETIGSYEKEKNSLESLVAKSSFLKSLQDDVKHLEKYISDKKQLELSIRREKENEDRETEEILSYETALKKSRDCIAELEKQVNQRREKENEKLYGEEKLRNFKRLSDSFLKVLSEEKRRESIEKELNDAKSNTDSYFKEYRRLSELWFQDEAFKLTDRLQENEPCPVCGSLSHPNPVKKPETAPTKEQLDRSESRYLKSNEESSKLSGTLQNQIKNLESIKAELQEELLAENIPYDFNVLEDLMEKQSKSLQDTSNEIKNLSSDKALDFERANEKKLTASLENSSSKKNEISKNLAVFTSTLDEISSNILRTEEKLLKEGLTLDSYRSAVEINSSEEKNARAKVNNIESLKRTYEELKTQLTTNSENFETHEKEFLESNSEFSDSLLNSSVFSNIEDFLTASKIPADSLKKKIKDYEFELNRIQGQLETKKEFLNQEIVSVDELKAEYEMTKSASEKLINEIGGLEKEIKTIEESGKEFEFTRKKIEDREREFQILNKLSKISRGEYGENRNRISLQNYVLSVYFDEILNRANARFNPMTSGRYSLHLYKGDSKGNKRGGLDINIFDTYTGKERSVKTLSGGETFKASMSLALGLSDMVQSIAGGIALDAVFIDEGFGTLDEDSLSSAMDVLLDLKDSGRTVGIISHVSELKQTIAAQIQITPTSRGSIAEVVI